MAWFCLNSKSKFITTEPLGKSGERGESKVWEAVKLAFTDRNCIAYWRYPIFSRVGKTRKEPDILIADVELGLIVIEVKSIRIDQIVAINGHRWEFQNFYATYGHPYQQAENQLFALLGYCDRSPTLRSKVTGRAIVALPFWKGSVIEFEVFSDRMSELSALSAHIWHNITQDYLNPCREILVIVLGEFFEAIELESHVAEFLISQGINIFIPGNTECNILNTNPENRNPNKFWCDGAVTVSRIHRAKGNEADMVYIVGCDNVAKYESNLALRNQLFIALTRAKGWVKLSGIDNYPMYEEIKKVLAGQRRHF